MQLNRRKQRQKNEAERRFLSPQDVKAVEYY